MDNEILETIQHEVKGFSDGVAALRTEQESYIDRLDRIEAAMKRVPTGGMEIKDAPTPESKAFEKFMRFGKEALNDIEQKSLTVGSNTDGGYLVMPEYEREIIKNSSGDFSNSSGRSRWSNERL